MVGDDQFESSEKKPKLVIPGDEVGSWGEIKQGKGIHLNGNRLIATKTGIVTTIGEKLSMVPLKDIYRPGPGDRVIGKIVDVKPDQWVVDINSFIPFPLYPGDTPWNVGFDHMLSFLDMGEIILARVDQRSGHSRLFLSMKGPGVRKLTKGYITLINISRLPRFVGREMETINRIRRETGCRILVGNNGVIWIEGKSEGVSRVVSIANLIAKTPPAVPVDRGISHVLEGGI